MPHASRSRLLLVALALVASLCACAPKSLYVRREAPRTLSEVEAAAAAFDNSRWSAVPAAQAPKMRADALASLRLGDANATLIADILTDEFSVSKGVPALIEETTVEGTPAWVVIEAYGAGEGALDRWRLWVLARPDGRVISSSTYR